MDHRRSSRDFVFVALVLATLLISNRVFADVQFIVETVEQSPNNDGEGSSMALDAVGNPHVSYFDRTTGGIKYAKRVGGAWSAEALPNTLDYFGWPSLALTGQGAPRIGYMYNDTIWHDLRYSKKSGGAWTIDYPPGDGLLGTSLALDRQGKAHISFINSQEGLVCSWESGTQWVTEVIDDSLGNWSSRTSLELDSLDNPHISYFDAILNDLMYAKRVGGAWSIETVDSAGNVGWFSSLALNRNGEPRIAYKEELLDDLKYASRSGGVWTIECVDASLDEVGSFASLALDSNENPHIAYFDATQADLMYALKSGSTWVVQPVEATPAADGSSCSLALDRHGNPYMSYYDATAGNLKYARLAAPTSVPASETARLRLSVSPNPASGAGARIQYTVVVAEALSPPELSIFDASGRRVAQLLPRLRASGVGTVSWDGTDANGRPVASGHYLIQLRSGPSIEIQRVTLIR